jgi:SnoaL-like domain
MSMGDSMPQRFLDANNAHNAGVSVANLFTPDETQEDVAAGVICTHRQAITAFMAQSEQAPNNRMTILSQQINGDHYAIEWEVAETNTGALADLPPPTSHTGSALGFFAPIRR